MIEFTNQQAAGFIPEFLSWDDKDSAQEQLHKNYAHGGGFRPTDLEVALGLDEGGRFSITFPEYGETFYEVSRGALRDELIVVFTSDFVAVMAADDLSHFVVARMD